MPRKQSEILMALV